MTFLEYLKNFATYRSDKLFSIFREKGDGNRKGQLQVWGHVGEGSPEKMSCLFLFWPSETERADLESRGWQAGFAPKPGGWWPPKSCLGPSAILQYSSYLFLKHKVGISFSFQKTSGVSFLPHDWSPCWVTTTHDSRPKGSNTVFWSSWAHT